MTVLLVLAWLAAGVVSFAVMVWIEPPPPTAHEGLLFLFYALLGGVALAITLIVLLSLFLNGELRR